MLSPAAMSRLGTAEADLTLWMNGRPRPHELCVRVGGMFTESHGWSKLGLWSLR